MEFIVPEKINRAVSISDVSRLYGKNNSDIIKSSLSIANISQNKLNSISSTANCNAHQAVQQTSVKSTIKRKRIVSSENLLIKGQKWTIAGKNVSIPIKLKIGIGWEVLNSACEVDASAFMLAKNGKVPDESCFIFYGQDKSSDNSVIFQSNSSNMNLLDDAEINISLDSVRKDVEKITICLTIYESFQRNLDFSMVKNIYARIMDGNGTEIARYNGEYLPESVTSLVIGELYRYKDSWKFYAIGSGYRKDLADFCGLYGIQLK
ncbi:MAG: TerD family protein [Ruminococcus sp.]|nr:TerD family protein [Ruminococcus sp.]